MPYILIIIENVLPTSNCFIIIAYGCVILHVCQLMLRFVAVLKVVVFYFYCICMYAFILKMRKQNYTTYFYSCNSIYSSCIEIVQKPHIIYLHVYIRPFTHIILCYGKHR